MFWLNLCFYQHIEVLCQSESQDRASVGLSIDGGGRLISLEWLYSSVSMIPETYNFDNKDRLTTIAEDPER